MAEPMISASTLLDRLTDQGLTISYRTLRYYATLGLIDNASVQKDVDGKVRGLYPASTVDRVLIVGLLQDRGLNLQQITDVMQFITKESAQPQAETLSDWRRKIADRESSPLLYDLLPLLGEQLRRQLVEMLQALRLSPESGLLEQVRLEMTSKTGATSDRWLFISDSALQVSQLNFWELTDLVALMAKTASQSEPKSLIQLRTWLQGRTDWALEDFWLARHQKQPIGCFGLQRPWLLRLQATAICFGPLVHPEYADLPVADNLLETAINHARSLDLNSLLTLVRLPGQLPTSWQAIGFQDLGEHTSYLISSTAGKISGELCVQPLLVDHLAHFFPGSPLTLLTQAASDTTMPSWTMLDEDGNAQAIAWLSYPDQTAWLHFKNEEIQQGDWSCLLETIKAAAKAKGFSRLRLWLPGTVFCLERLSGKQPRSMDLP